MSCPFYDFKSTLFGGDFYCKKDEKYVNSDIYYRYCRDYSYSDCPIYKHHESSGCFITTVVCDILGKKDDGKLLNNLRDFRDNVLQKDEKYDEVLKCYDTIGPVLSNFIKEDEDRDVLADSIYKNILVPVNDFIEKKDYDRACETYYVMTLGLINYYGIKHPYNHYVDNNYGYLNEMDREKSGHGYKKVLVKDC